MKKKNIKVETGIKKATIIIVLKTGEVISQKGTFDGIKTEDGRALFTARFIKSLSK